MIDIDISLGVGQQEIPEQFRGEFTTMERALATAVALKGTSGGVVFVKDESLLCPSPVPPGLAFVTLYFADGRQINAALAALKLKNNPDLRGFDSWGATPASAPQGVSYGCTERQYYLIRQALADTRLEPLAVVGGGVIAEGGLDTEVEPGDKLGVPPAGPANTKHNFVIVLAGGAVVNAAFIGKMLNVGPDAALAFAKTRGAK